MSLRTKIILVLLLFSTVPVAVIGYIETVWSTQSLKRQVGESSLEFARLSLLRITDYLYTKFETVKNWPFVMNLPDIMETGRLNDVSNMLGHLTNIHDEFYYIVLADLNNTIVASSDCTLIGSQLPPFSGFDAAKKGTPMMKNVAFNPIAGGHALIIAVPVKDPGDNSKAVGVLSAALKWQEINSMITGLRINGRKQDIDNHLMLINNDSLTISCFDSEEMFTTNPLDLKMVSTVYTLRRNEGYLFETSEHDRHSFITYTYQRKLKDMPRLNWRMIFLQDPDRVFASAKAFAKTSALLLPVIIGGFAVISIIFARRLTKPILAIASAAKLLGKGDLDRRVPVRSHDEIGVLANSFNTMAGDLQQAKNARDEAEYAVRESQASLNEAQRIAHLGNWEWDLKAQTAIWSDEHYRIFGYKPGEVKVDYDLFVNCIHQDDRDKVIKLMDKALAGKAPFEFEYRIVRPDKIEKTILCQAEVIRDGAGEAVRVIGTALDITERRRVQEKLLHLSSAVEQNKEGVGIADMEGNILYVNTAFAEMHGFAPEDILGEHISIFHTPEQMPEVEDCLSEVMETGVFNGELWHARRDGSVFCGHVYDTLMHDEQGRPIGIIATLRDITESKEMAEELDVYREQINRTERLAALGTLSATVAHELNQPLTVIRLMLQNCLVELHEVKASHAIIDNIEDSLAEVDKSSGIIQRFLAASRPADSLSTRQVDAGKIPEIIAGLFAHSAKRARISLNLGKELPDILPCVYGSADMEQIFFILTENAIHAADGSRQRRLDISGSCENGQVKLKFTDDCSGIEAENIKRIFEPFFTTKPREEGTGLGLSIVKRILDRHDGSIRVESTAGKGTTFHISLPAYDHCC